MNAITPLYRLLEHVVFPLIEVNSWARSRDWQGTRSSLNKLHRTASKLPAITREVLTRGHNELLTVEIYGEAHHCFDGISRTVALEAEVGETSLENAVIILSRKLFICLDEYVKKFFTTRCNIINLILSLCFISFAIKIYMNNLKDRMCARV